MIISYLRQDPIIVVNVITQVLFDRYPDFSNYASRFPVVAR